MNAYAVIERVTRRGPGDGASDHRPLCQAGDVEMAHHEESQIASHLLAAIPHATYAECFADPERDPMWQAVWSNRPPIKGGLINVPTGPASRPFSTPGGSPTRKRSRRCAGIFLCWQGAIILLGTAALGSVAAEETRPAKPPAEEAAGPSAPAPRMRSMHDLLWLPRITNRDNLDLGLRRLLETLDKSKVPTAEEAKGAALLAKLKAGGLLAEEGARVVGLVRLGVDVAEFATSGDLVWVVQIEHAVRGVTQEVWVSSTTGAVRAMLPQARPGPQ